MNYVVFAVMVSDLGIFFLYFSFSTEHIKIVKRLSSVGFSKIGNGTLMSQKWSKMDCLYSKAFFLNLKGFIFKIRNYFYNTLKYLLLTSCYISLRTLGKCPHLHWFSSWPLWVWSIITLCIQLSFIFLSCEVKFNYWALYFRRRI